MTFSEFVTDVLSRVLPDGDSARLTSRHTNWVKDCLIELQRYAVCRQTGHTDEYAFDETDYNCGASTVTKPVGIPTLIKIENTSDACDIIVAKEVTESVMRGALINTDMCNCGTPSDAVETPVASILTGTYNNDLSVTLTCGTAGASIFWTTDDGDGLTDFAAYTGAIPITETGTTLRFYATKDNLPDSDTGSEVYTLQVATPVLNPSGLSFAGSTGAVSTTSTTGATQRYTTNGDEPDSGSTLYSGSISMVATTTIRIRGFKANYLESDIEEETYTLYEPPVSPVTFSPTDGNFIGTTNVTMATVTPAPYEIRYTDDGSTPTAASTLYAGAVNINASKLFKAIVVKVGYASIAASEKQYTQTVPQVAPVTFTPTNGNFIITTNVALACATSGATIRYTTDGSPPTGASPVYSSPITVTADTTIRAFATKTYYADSTPTAKVMTLVIPQTFFFDRSAPASVFLNDLYSEAQRTITIGAHTNLYVEADGSAITFDLTYDGVPVFGTQTAGTDGLDDVAFAQSATLSGAATTLILQVDTSNTAYYRAAGNPYSYTNLYVYSY